MAKKRHPGLHLSRKLIILAFFLAITVLVFLIVMPSPCEDSGGTCRTSCAVYEHEFRTSCGIKSFYKACCHPLGDCDDECTDSGFRICEGASFKECGQFDKDPCLDWSLPMPCDFNQGCYRGQCSDSNRGLRCIFTENCTSGLVCKSSGRYGLDQRYCCYSFECASILDPDGICVIDGGRDIMENGSWLVCAGGNWTVQPQ